MIVLKPVPPHPMGGAVSFFPGKSLRHTKSRATNYRKMQAFYQTLSKGCDDATISLTISFDAREYALRGTRRTTHKTVAKKPVNRGGGIYAATPVKLFFLAVVESGGFTEAASAATSPNPPCPNKSRRWSKSWVWSCCTGAGGNSP